MTAKDEDGATIVPFGKYKGSDVTELLKDRSYIEWLLAQPWLPQRFPTVHAIIIGGGSRKVRGKKTKQDSPAHNEMQVRFLDPALCERLGRRYISSEEKLRSYLMRANPKGGVTYEVRIERLKYEQKYWDVTFTISATMDDLTGERVGAVSMAHLYVELKPSIADDFFAVLRQVTTRRDQQNARESAGQLARYVVVTDQIAPSNVTVDQVRAAFKTQNVDLVLSSELEQGQVAA